MAHFFRSFGKHYLIVRNRFYAKFPACECYDNRTGARLQKISSEIFNKLFTAKKGLKLSAATWVIHHHVTKGPRE